MYLAAGLVLFTSTGQSARAAIWGDRMSELNPQPLPPKEIRITAPAGVLTDLDAFRKAQAAVLSQAGCPGCHSGLRLIWQEFSEYEIDVEGRVSPVRGGAGPAGLG